MHRKLKLGLDLGLGGNVVFLIFAVLTYVYMRLSAKASDKTLLGLERFEYFLLFLGFAMLLASACFLTSTLRMRAKFKIAYWVYICMEAFIMYCELNSYETKSFYHPYSLGLAIAHALISAAICFTFIQLDPYKKPFEILIIVCIGIILAGMMGNILEIRLYFSVITNAAAYALMFGGIKYMLSKEIVEIDCHGDAARVAEYRGFFDDTPSEPTDAQKAAQNKDNESNEE